ncbi:MAG: hypothetical protein Sapg2KO_37720 [Saprospiraceae bacterium]
MNSNSLIRFLIVILFGGLLSSFQVPNDDEPAPSPLYYYLANGQKVSLGLDIETVVVQFKEKVDTELRASFVRSFPGIAQTTALRSGTTFPKSLNISLNIRGLSTTKALDYLETVRKHPAVYHATPTYTYGSTKLFTQQRIIVKPKLDQIDAIQSFVDKTQTVIEARKDRPTGPVFHLRVTDQSIGNPLFISNFLFETGAFEYCEPDLLMLMSRTSAQNREKKSELSNLACNPSASQECYSWAIHNQGGGVIYNSGTPNEVEIDFQEDADMDVLEAWGFLGSIGKTPGEGRIVAVIDDGVDTLHDDLKNRIYKENGKVVGFDAVYDEIGGQFNFTPEGVYCVDLSTITVENTKGAPVNNNTAHGTSVGGIISAEKDNGIGVSGVAPNTYLMPIRVFHDLGCEDNCGPGTYTSNTIIENAVYFAVANGADIINMSLGGGPESNGLNIALDYAFSQNRLLFAAVGNRNNSVIDYPANHPNVFAVGASSMCDEIKRSSNQSMDVDEDCGYNTDFSGVSCDDEKWWGSNYGLGLDVVAPGVKVKSTTTNNGYTNIFNGTSAATPNVAGVAALIRSINPDLSPIEVYEIIKSTTDEIGGLTGRGRVNAFKAVQAAYYPDNEVDNLARLEYFFDNDPGLGLGIPIDIPGNSTDFNAAVTVDLSNLEQGLHTLYIRARDENGRWSFTQRRSFYLLSQNESQTADLVYLEYFINEDPGFGNAIELPPFDNQDSQGDYLINLQDKEPGIHTIYVRARTNDGKWSMVTRQMFYIQQELSGSREVVELEYYFNEDPGEGNGISVDIVPDDLVETQITIPASELEGNQRIFFRAKDNLEEWSFQVTDTLAWTGNEITVTYPNGGEMFDVNTEINNINWSTQNAVGPVNIELVKAEGGQRWTIANNVDPQGPYSAWIIPAWIPSGNYRIKIYDRSDPSILDFSDTPFSIVSPYESGCNRVQDSLALVVLYNSTLGQSWRNSWNLSQPMDNWNGVVLGNGRVVQLNLEGKELTGALPPEIGNLCELTTLDLRTNKIRGAIPKTIGNLTKLTKLDLWNNDLTGELPVSLDKLVNLTELILGNNSISGNIPGSITRLTKLIRLDLGYNNFDGTIPEWIGTLSDLTYLALGNNNLAGYIPTQLGNLDKVRFLYLDFNQLEGSIPVEFRNLSSIEFLYMSSNQLSGSIPQELSELLNLRFFFVDQNQLSGPIPSSFGLLPRLDQLYINDNQLKGQIPKELGDISTLVRLLASNNQLTGEIPKELGNLTNLQQLFFDNNQLSGCFPSELMSLCTVNQKDFSNNPELPWGGDFARFCSGEPQPSNCLPPQIEVNVSSTSPFTNTELTVMIRVLNNQGVALSNEPVTIDIQGGNTAGTSTTTDSDGYIEYSYTGSNPGTDMIKVSVREVMETVDVEWVPLPDIEEIELIVSETNPMVCTAVNIQANALDDQGNGIPGVDISLDIHGVNDLLIVLTTNENGQVEYSYRGLQLGLDFISVTADGGTNTTEVEWIDSNIPQLVALEITQAAQNLKNETILIEGKSTLVRAYLKGYNPNLVIPKLSVSLEVLDENDNLLGTFTPGNLVTNFSVPLDPIAERSELDSTLNFFFDANEYEALLSGKRKFRLNYPGLCCNEISEPNGVQADCQVEVEFLDSPGEITIIFYTPIIQSLPGTETFPLAISGDIIEELNKIRSILPLADKDVKVEISSLQKPVRLPFFYKDLYDKINNELEAERYKDTRIKSLEIQENGHLKTRHFQSLALIGPNVPTGDPWGESNWKNSASAKVDNTFSNPYIQSVSQHELLHSFGFTHIGSCNAPLPSEPRDFVDGQVSWELPYLFDVNSNSNIATIGDLNQNNVDINFGFDFYKNRVISPYDEDENVAFELMSYCGSQEFNRDLLNEGRSPISNVSKWMSDKSYEQFYGYLKDYFEAGNVQIVTPRSNESDYYLISGNINFNTKEVNLDSFFIYSSIAPPVNAPGDYELCLIDQNGLEIECISVNITAGAEDNNSGYFTFFSPYSEDIFTVQIKENSSVLAEITRTPNKPTVRITSPSQNELLEGSFDLEWVGFDADPDDRLHYQVEISTDGGNTWRLLAINHDETSLTISTQYIGESNSALIRVQVTDGLNTGEDISNLFSIANSAPVGVITSPNDQQKFFNTGIVRFDSEILEIDELAEDVMVTWYSSLDGGLGTGLLKIPVENLSEGKHTITAIFEDPDGGVSTKQVEIEVFRYAFEDGPEEVSIKELPSFFVGQLWLFGFLILGVTSFLVFGRKYMR